MGATKQYASRAGAERSYIVNPIRINGIEYVAGNEGIDASTQSLQVVDYEHHEIHSGDHYFLKRFVDLPVNNVWDIQITTPNTTKWSHFLFGLSSEKETLWEFYEGVTIDTAGVNLQPRNNNRNSSNTSGMTVGGILNTSTVNANADTGILSASLIATGTIGSGPTSGGVSARSEEIILKQNTSYSLRITASVAGYTNYTLEWYEHTAKN